MTVKSFQLAGVCFVILTASICGRAQRDNPSLFGEVKIRVKGTAPRATPPQATVILFRPSGKELALPTGPEFRRQTVTNGGRYRFSDLPPGEYELAVEIDHHEVSRSRIFLSSLHAPYGLQHDIAFDWQPLDDSTKSPTISAADVYERTSVNKRLFRKAEDAVVEKNYDQAISLLKQMVASDKADYQAQTILGTLLGSQGKYDEAEQAYLSALSAKPTFAPALLDFGRLRLKQKRFADAVEPLTKLVELEPDSGEANLLLGDAYAQMDQRPKAIPHLNSAASLGYPEAHLRLAWIYDAAGSREKAALEYQEFLKKKPDYPDRQKLEGYIKANKKN
ncbi:MAG TPA: tetratricopeptide repeat protein [Pyrinomonadaceae bacterium]